MFNIAKWPSLGENRLRKDINNRFRYLLESDQMIKDEKSCSQIFRCNEFFDHSFYYFE